MENFLDLFTNLNSREGLYLWLMMLVSFLFGFIIALLLRAARIRRLKKDLAEAQRLQQEAQAQTDSLHAQVQERNAELQEASREKVELMERLNQLEAEKKQHYNDIYQLNQQIEELQGTNRAYAATVDELNEQLIGAQTQEETTLEAAPLDLASTGPIAENTSTDYQALQDRLNSVENTVQKLASENTQLRADLAELKTTEAPSTRAAVAVASTEQEEEPAPRITTDKQVLHEKIIVDDRQPDDLTQIAGLGPFLQKKLNNIGVYTYDDIAAWDTARIAEVTEQIEFFPGRIERDDWVGQAAKLAANRTTDTSTSSDRGPATDLKIIEGIGPKIEEILKAGDINDWSELAAADPGRLRELLEQAGGQFRMHNPYTWPLQARLAAGGRWEELDEYQDELKGGREVS